MTDQIDLIIADLDNYTRGEIVALALNVNANLRSNPPLGTPVDTGWASANWVPSIGKPATDYRKPVNGEPSPAEVAARNADIQEGTNAILSWRLEDGPIFSTNNVPYIQALNAGHSPQSPAGFVLGAIEKAVRQTYSRAKAKGERDGRAAAARANKRRPL